MFDLDNDYKNAIQEVRIEFGDLVNKPKGDVYIVLCEPTTKDCLLLRRFEKADYSNPEKMMGYFFDILPRIIVDHNFIRNGQKAGNDDVVAFIGKKMEVSDFVAGEYLKKVFISPQSKTREK